MIKYCKDTGKYQVRIFLAKLTMRNIFLRFTIMWTCRSLFVCIVLTCNCFYAEEAKQPIPTTPIARQKEIRLYLIEPPQTIMHHSTIFRINLDANGEGHYPAPSYANGEFRIISQNGRVRVDCNGDGIVDEKDGPGYKTNTVFRIPIIYADKNINCPMAFIAIEDRFVLIQCRMVLEGVFQGRAFYIFDSFLSGDAPKLNRSRFMITHSSTSEKMKSISLNRFTPIDDSLYEVELINENHSIRFIPYSNKSTLLLLKTDPSVSDVSANLRHEDNLQCLYLDKEETAVLLPGGYSCQISVLRIKPFPEWAEQLRNHAAYHEFMNKIDMRQERSVQITEAYSFSLTGIFTRGTLNHEIFKEDQPYLIHLPPGKTYLEIGPPFQLGFSAILSRKQKNKIAILGLYFTGCGDEKYNGRIICDRVPSGMGGFLPIDIFVRINNREHPIGRCEYNNASKLEKNVLYLPDIIQDKEGVELLVRVVIPWVGVFEATRTIDAIESISITPEILQTFIKQKMKAKQWEDTIFWYEEGIIRFPDNYKFLNSLAWHLLTCPEIQFRNPTRALVLAEKAVTLSNENMGYILDTYALALHDTGNLEKAVQYQELAVAKEPNNHEIIQRAEQFRRELQEKKRKRQPLELF